MKKVWLATSWGTIIGAFADELSAMVLIWAKNKAGTLYVKPVYDDIPIDRVEIVVVDAPDEADTVYQVCENYDDTQTLFSLPEVLEYLRHDHIVPHGVDGFTFDKKGECFLDYELKAESNVWEECSVMRHLIQKWSLNSHD